MPYFEEVLNDVLSLSLRVPEPLNILNVVVQDPSDDIFLACALVASADYIVSGDKHLLDLKNFAGIPILTPRQCLYHF